MIRTPLVSVVMPAFNRAEFIGEAIESIQRQTLTNLELLVVDDGSTDETFSIATRAAQCDERLRVIRLEQNGGISRALNVGFRESRGLFIARLDSDDRAAPERIATQLDAFEQSDRLVAVGSHVRLFGEVPEEIVRYPLGDAEIKANLIAACNTISGGLAMVRRTFTDQHQIVFNENLRVAEDLDYLISIMEKGGLLGNVDSALVDYRVYARNTTNLHGASFLPCVQQVRQRLLALWFPMLSEEDRELLSHMFCEPFPPHIDALLRTSRAVERMIELEPVNYGQNFEGVRQFALASLRKMGLVYRDHGLFNRFHLETISAFLSGATLDALKIIA